MAPIAVLPVSATEGIGMDALLVQLGRLMEDEDGARRASGDGSIGKAKEKPAKEAGAYTCSR